NSARRAKREIRCKIILRFAKRFTCRSVDKESTDVCRYYWKSLGALGLFIVQCPTVTFHTLEHLRQRRELHGGIARKRRDFLFYIGTIKANLARAVCAACNS